MEFTASFADAPLIEELLVGQGWSPAVERPARSRAPVLFSLYAAEGDREGAELRARLQACFAEWNQWLSAAVSEFSCRRVRRQDWAESWKLHFKPLRIGRRLIVKPSWSEVDLQGGEQVVELDPGMSFGTGQHGTTRACLEFVEQLSRRLEPGASFLDVGCGSGILSLAAAALGFCPVVAFDYDETSSRVARENVGRSPYADAIRVETADLRKYPLSPRYRVVAANLLAPIIIRNAARLHDLLDVRSGAAYLLVSGILDEQYGEAAIRMRELGLREEQNRLLEGWRSGCFVLE